jgi:hypothetical protein
MHILPPVSVLLVSMHFDVLRIGGRHVRQNSNFSRSRYE